jgi:energy-converting hydrogenase Eha subunit C
MAILSVLGLRRRKARLLMLALVLLGMMMLASCNDYYYYTYTGTLPGTFSVVITGTVGTVQHSTVFNLTVL